MATDGQVKSVKFLTERMGEMMALNVQLRQELKNRHPDLSRKENENVYSQEGEWIYLKQISSSLSLQASCTNRTESITKLSLQLTNKYKSLIIGKKTPNKLIEQDEFVTIVVCLISNVFCS